MQEYMKLGRKITCIYFYCKDQSAYSEMPPLHYYDTIVHVHYENFLLKYALS